MVINTRERAISPDINRLQDFVAAARAEIFRAMFNDVLGNFYVRPGISFRPTTSPTDAPLPADVYGGLEVIVDDPANLHIEPGILMAYTGAAASSDDSSYVIATDLNGVFTPGLTFVANPGPGQRIDVVECRPTDVLRESDSRDEYDEVTGLFTPAVVEKVRESDLEYRIRSGTPGNGPPGYDTGWLPLAVAIVQQGAADWSEVDFYDVRPLVAERSPVPTQEYPGEEFVGDVASTLDQAELLSDDQADLQYQGSFRGQFNGYYFGGDIRRNTPSPIADFGSSTPPNGGETDAMVVQSSTRDQAAGFAYALDTMYAVAALFLSLSATNPGHLLPRWVRYSQTAAGDPPARRRPTGARGILVVTDVVNLGMNGLIKNVNAPTLMGWPFAGHARVFAIGKVSPTGPTSAKSIWQNGGWTEQNGHAIAHTTISLNEVQFDLVANQDYPANATRLRCNIQVQTNDTPAQPQYGQIQIGVRNLTNQSVVLNQAQYRFFTFAESPSGDSFVTVTFEIPLPAPPRAGYGGTPPVIRVTADAVNFGTAIGGIFRIVGWKSR